MSQLRLPFWIAIERKPAASATRIAFTTPERLEAFLNTGNSPLWKSRLVLDRVNLALFVADMHASGATTLVVDPDQDGSGEVIKLADLVAQLGSS